MSRRYRVAVVGAGIGAKHVEGYNANPDKFDVAVICDRDQARAAIGHALRDRLLAR